MSKLFLNNLPMCNFFTMCSYIIKLFLILSQYITSTFLYVNFIRSPCLNYFLNKALTELFLQQGSDRTISWSRSFLNYFLNKAMTELFLEQGPVYEQLIKTTTISWSRSFLNSFLNKYVSETHCVFWILFLKKHQQV